MDPLPPDYDQVEIEVEPPSYNRPSFASGRSTATRQPTEHVYHLTGGFSDKPWGTLKLFSGAASPDALPLFLEGDSLSGNFELDVKKESIVEISLQMTGHIMYTQMGGLDPQGREGFFLDHSEVIWSQSMGDPKTPEESSNTEKYTEKLHGQYSWPFKIAIPHQVPGKSSAAQLFSLPATFSERATRVGIHYEMHINVRRTKFHANSQVGTTILYIPRIKPDPPSSLRQLAYHEGTPIPGPTVDPEGWKVLKSFTMNGSILNARAVQVTCTLSLAKPLCYTRGTPIPCILIMESSDEQALDLLSSPKAITVRLQRRMVYSSKADRRPQSNAETVEWKAAVDYLDTAVWWPAPGDQTNSSRTLNGEFLLSKELKPSAEVLDFSIKYSVAVFPSQAASFHPANNGSRAPILMEGVEIGTILPSGPRARAYAPSGHSNPAHEGHTNVYYSEYAGTP